MDESEVSVMSGMSDMSGAGGGQQEEKKDDTKTIILLMGPCCLLFLGAVAFALAYLNAGNDPSATRESTEDPEYIPPGASGGGFSPHPAQVQTHPPVQSSPAAASQTGSVKTALKKKRKQMPLRPLICQINTDMKPGYPYPDDGICDFMFITIGFENESDHLSYGFVVPDDETKLILSEYSEQANKSKLTSYGLDLYDHASVYTIQVMRKDLGKNIMRNLWKSGIHHYGTLGMTVYTSVWIPYINENIEIMQILRGLCEEYISLQEEENCFLFLGITPLADPSGHKFEVINTRFETLVSNILPDALLFRTTLIDWVDRCTISAPSQWQPAHGTAELPSFEDVFTMRKNVTWPETTRELLSFGSFCLYMTDVDWSEEYHIGTHCNTLTFGESTLRCDPGDLLGTLHKTKNGMDQFYLNESWGTAVSFETEESMKKKMCRVAVEHKFTGGWAMMGIEFATEDGSACTDMTYKGNFQLLKALKDFMNLTFTSC